MTDHMFNRIILLLMQALSHDRERGTIHSFLYAPTSNPWAERGAEIYYSTRYLTFAALHARQDGPPALSAVPFSFLRSELKSFVRENFGLIAPHLPFPVLKGSFADHVPPNVRAELANLLRQSRLFSPINLLTLFPLVTVQVRKPFASAPFSLSDPSSLRAYIPANYFPETFLCDSFPPVPDWSGRRDNVNAWLGVNSPNVHAAQKTANAVLGAIALTLLPRTRYLFSGRSIFGGRCTLGSGYTISWEPPLTPRLMNDVVVSEADHLWLTKLANLIDAEDKAARRKVRALEYFHRSWPLSESDRFPILCMCLDGLFGDQNLATQSVVEGVRENLGVSVDEKRLKLLMGLRASVIHGGAPDVYDSNKYAKYYKDYGDDPIFDLELVVAECLRSTVFKGDLRTHPDPEAALIADLQSRGRLPKNLVRSSILNPG